MSRSCLNCLRILGSKNVDGNLWSEGVQAEKIGGGMLVGTFVVQVNSIRELVQDETNLPNSLQKLNCSQIRSFETRDQGRRLSILSDRFSKPSQRP